MGKKTSYFSREKFQQSFPNRLKKGMLVLLRRPRQSIIIDNGDDKIEVVIKKVSFNSTVFFGIKAPLHIKIHKE